MTAPLFISFIGTLALAGVLLLLVTTRRKPRVYKPKGQFLLSPGEKRFFDALTASIPPSLYICPKVRIADLVEISLSPTDPNYWRSVAPMNQKHVDFVLVNRSDFAPQCVIELDGGSHTDKQRLARDTFVNSIFASTGIPILHIPVTRFYSYVDLRAAIEKTLLERSKLEHV